MILSKIYKNTLLILAACLVLTACATKKEVATDAIQGQMQGDVYTGTDSVEYLASGVKDRVFFATNKSTLTTASRDTLRKQAAWMRKKKKLTLSVSLKKPNNVSSYRPDKQKTSVVIEKKSTKSSAPSRMLRLENNRLEI